MISGRVTNREAIIGLDVAGPDQPPRQIEAVIDTGYNGFLTLPSSLVSSLQLPFAGHRRGTLADGSTSLLSVYIAGVVWHGHEQEVLVSQAPGLPLVGMSLLLGSRLTINVTESGDVAIHELGEHA